MTHHVVLVSRDEELAARVRRALPATIAIELHCAESLEPPPEGAGWLLVLLDGETMAPGMLPYWPRWPTPVLWLGARPGITDLCERLPGAQERIVDYLDRREALSKLAFILHQHLAAAYLRRMRGPRLVEAAPQPSPEELHRRLNNALTGILGNAALALDGGRLPASLGKRLQRIADLAAEMREALARIPAPASAPRPKAA